MLTLTKITNMTLDTDPVWQGELILCASTPTHARLAASQFHVLADDNEITLTITGKQREVEEELESQAEYVRQWLDDNDMMIRANIALQEEIAEIKKLLKDARPVAGCNTCLTALLENKKDITQLKHDLELAFRG
jgi:hypothetical protein